MSCHAAVVAAAAAAATVACDRCLQAARAEHAVLLLLPTWHARRIGQQLVMDVQQHRWQQLELLLLLLLWWGHGRCSRTAAAVAVEVWQ